MPVIARFYGVVIKMYFQVNIIHHIFMPYMVNI